MSDEKIAKQSSDNDARKSTVDYWDENWRRASSNAIPGSDSRSRSYFWHRMDSALAKCLGDQDWVGCRLIEIGAGASEWLPYLGRRFGFKVEGLDYSSIGCQRARENLAKHDVPGVIHQSDMFDPPILLLGQYDVVVSFGVVEHFSDTRSAIEACAAFLKPGGLIITLIPNMKGLHGWLYRIFDKKIFDIHVPLSSRDLVRAHIEAGLKVFLSEYLLGLPGVADQNRNEPVAVRRMLRRMMFYLSRFYWGLEARGLGIPENPLTSPYIVCAAKKAGEL
jgi:2-polyprenyl-3-methyl-5-hydroxy-6-metoxy-1,4-benzoquinol methylase